MKLLLPIALLPSLILMGGCTDSELIKEVKKRPINDQYTYEQAFERDYCKTSKWELEKDGSNRDVVKFTCEYEIDNETIVNYVNTEINLFSNSFFDIYEITTQDWFKKFQSAEQEIKDAYKVSTWDSERSKGWYEEELEKSKNTLSQYYGINSFEEARIAIDALAARYQEDTTQIKNKLIPDFKKLLLENSPKKWSIKKELRIVLLPNNTDKWFAPVFHIEELGIEFPAEVSSILTTDSTSPDTIERLNRALLVRFMKIDKKDFANYVLNECANNTCGLNLPFLSYNFSNVEDGNWD